MNSKSNNKNKHRYYKNIDNNYKHNNGNNNN